MIIKKFTNHFPKHPSSTPTVAAAVRVQVQQSLPSLCQDQGPVRGEVRAARHPDRDDHQGHPGDQRQQVLRGADGEADLARLPPGVPLPE